MKKIFIIEDDETLAGLFSEMLQDELTDVDTKTFGDGISALNEIDENGAPDAIVLDLILNGPTGFALLNELRGYADTARIPVIVCSSLAPELSDLCGYGVAKVLDKASMRPADLAEAVRGVKSGAKSGL